MIKRLSFFACFLFGTTAATAQVFDVDTLLYNGDPSRYINIVFMGDGYTSAQQADFIDDATGSMNYLFAQSPWSHYEGSFNVFAIKVISNESGAKHPNIASDCGGSGVPTADPDNYFGSTFDNFDIHRLIYPPNSTPVFQVLAVNCPFYDQAVVLVNSPYYGGAGGAFATLTTDGSVNEVLAHELGHSFAGLADEYYAGEAYFSEKANMTQESDPLQIRWKNWVGSNGVGVNAYCCGGTADTWFKPHTDCKMEYLGVPYCRVCSQAIIERIHDLTNPIVSYTPQSLVVADPVQLLDFELTELIPLVPATYKVQWKLNGTLLASNVNAVQIDQSTLPLAINQLALTVEDTTILLRVDDHASVHLSTVTWTINRSIAGLEILPKDNRISLSVFPNPSSGQATAAIRLEKPAIVSVQLLAMDGKIIASPFGSQLTEASEIAVPLNLSGLPAGMYKVLFTIDGAAYSESLIVE